MQAQMDKKANETQAGSNESLDNTIADLFDT